MNKDLKFELEERIQETLEVFVIHDGHESASFRIYGYGLGLLINEEDFPNISLLFMDGYDNEKRVGVTNIRMLDDYGLQNPNKSLVNYIYNPYSPKGWQLDKNHLPVNVALESLPDFVKDNRDY